MKKRKCEFCPKTYQPQRKTQRTCGADSCMRALRRKLSLAWYYANKGQALKAQSKYYRENYGVRYRIYKPTCKNPSDITLRPRQMLHLPVNQFLRVFDTMVLSKTPNQKER